MFEIFYKTLKSRARYLSVQTRVRLVADVREEFLCKFSSRKRLLNIGKAN